uniref:Lipoyl-binding domain-containing protein n=1 Tax=Pycnococcus provasolii TaxID=41880 RepID=A0A7S2F4A9_9CHLO
MENRRVQVASPHGETVEKMSSRAYVDGKPLDAELVVANRGIANAWVGEGTASMDLRILSEEEASAEDATADLEASSGKSAAGVGGLGASADPSKVASPLFGQVARISASCIRGQAVKRGEPLVWVTSMKLEHELAARRDGVVADVLVEVGEQVKEGQVVVTLDRWGKVTDSD